ncbi:hypothetical protein [Loktanella sp. M215]|uniref:hypothetical protein n=1 Tax=Loktanella sp. M215 TaxID=2675431 RepID=UPI001F330D20|nr:hypothetical protein [Loktanella sp. M215]MCF7698239.1 hypothetical protein [Loktanella sp. M215]
MANTHTDVSTNSLLLPDQLGKLSSEQRQKVVNHTDEHRLLDELEARRLRQSRIDIFMKKCANAVDRRDQGKSALTKSEREVVNLVTGGDRYRQTRLRQTFSCVASNPYARNIFFDGVYSQLEQNWQHPSASMYFATFIDRDWCLPKGAKTVDIASMQARTEGALKEMGWDAILFLEIQAVANLGKVKFLAHLHGFLWKRGSKGVGVRRLQNTLNQKFQGIGHSKGVTLMLVKKSHPNALSTRFFYATKLPDTGKSFSPVQNSEKSYNLDSRGRMKASHPKNYTDLDALRTARMLGQQQIDDIVFAVGEGSSVKASGADALTAKVETLFQAKPDPTPARVSKAFSKLLRDREE